MKNVNNYWLYEKLTVDFTGKTGNSQIQNFEIPKMSTTSNSNRLWPIIYWSTREFVMWYGPYHIDMNRCIWYESVYVVSILKLRDFEGWMSCWKKSDESRHRFTGCYFLLILLTRSIIIFSIFKKLVCSTFSLCIKLKWDEQNSS